MADKEKKKNKKWLVVVIAFIVLLGCIGAFAMHNVADKKAAKGGRTDSVATELDADVTEKTEEKAEKADSEAEKDDKVETTTEGTLNADMDSVQTQGGNVKPASTEKEQPAQTAQSGGQAVSNQPKPTTTEAAKPKATTEQPKATTEAAKPEPTTQQQTTTEVYQPQAVWVVDTPAWDEEVPVYETRIRWICTGCGGYMYTQEDVDNHRCNASWYSDTYSVQTGTQTIHHAEVGHWEYK